ncbi:MAG: Gfo/Idh/MocA family oxidoreductase [Deltaproteobacteria bacterium]|nr:Gfo/Idh/MocA family oxidoreductase [Deltaproteobacteria bacterium]
MLKGAVVGVGYLGKFHAEKYHNSKQVDLVALVDPNPENASKLANKFGAIYTQDYKMLPSLGVQCASISSITSTHYEIAAWLLENGIDVLVEKPITTTIEDAEKLVALAKKNNRILQVGHLERFNPAFRAMKDVMSSPRYFEVRRIAPFSGRSFDVDVISDVMIHDLDIVAHLTGQELLKVEAVGTPVITNSYDVVSARITFTGGAVANITASRTALVPERTIRIFQPDLYISLDFGKRKLKIYRLSEEKQNFGLFPNVDVQEIPVREEDALQAEIDSFVNCVAERKEPEATGQDGVRALKFANAVRAAIAEHNEKFGFLPHA